MTLARLASTAQAFVISGARAYVVKDAPDTYCSQLARHVGLAAGHAGDCQPGKDMFIEKLQKERAEFARERIEYVDKLIASNRKVGELETKLLQLEPR